MHPANPQSDDSSSHKFASGRDFFNDGKPISVKVFGKFHNESRFNLLHTSSLAVCHTPPDYFIACSLWLRQMSISDVWFFLSNLDSMSVETELGDVICEYHR